MVTVDGVSKSFKVCDCKFKLFATLVSARTSPVPLLDLCMANLGGKSLMATGLA